MNERLEYSPRRARVVVLEDERDLEELIHAWLARRGLTTVPIHSVSGDPDRLMGSGYPPSRISLRSVIGRADVEDPDRERLEAESKESGAATVVIVAEPRVDAADTAEPWLFDLVQPQGNVAASRHALDDWIDTLQEGFRSGERDHVRLGPLDISSARRSVRVRGSDVHLTPTEFRLLCYLVENADRVVGHAELLRSVWGPGYEDDIHLLQQTIRSLRARIALVTDNPLIESVYGVGYRMANWPVENASSS